jgi:site-specific recombinase XerD
MVRVILILLYCTGLRIREALSLTIADIDLSQSLLTIRGTKFYKTRLVPYGTQLSKIITCYIVWRSNHGYSKNKNSSFFINDNKKSLSVFAMEGIFRKIRKSAGIRRTDKSRYQPRLHDIRHTFAVHRLTSWYKEHSDAPFAWRQKKHSF